MSATKGIYPLTPREASLSRSLFSGEQTFLRCIIEAYLQGTSVSAGAGTAVVILPSDNSEPVLVQPRTACYIQWHVREVKGGMQEYFSSSPCFNQSDIPIFLKNTHLFVTSSKFQTPVSNAISTSRHFM